MTIFILIISGYNRQLMKIMGIIDKQFIKRPLLRRFITRLFYGNKDKIVNFLSTSLYINSLKENGYLRAGKYADKSSVFRDEVSILINLASFITPGTTFIDVGANVGLYCSSFARFQKVYQHLEIYAFEANPDTFSRLSKTVEDKNIEIFNVALSNNNKELDFVEGVVSHVFAEKTNINSYHLKNRKTVKVEAKRLDSFNIEGDSIMLKIDVEGHEYEVLEGAKGLFEAGRIRVVYLDGYKKQEAILSFLKNYGFKLFDGKTLEPDPVYNFSLLALCKDYNE
jgi:FkbM family methyltransferase